jgi:hypothetical protein
MEESQTWAGRSARRIDGQVFEAVVVIRAWPTNGKTSTGFAPEAAAELASVFGPEADHYRQGVCSSIEVQISWANVAGEMPAVGRSRFGVEVVAVQAPRDALRQVSEALLMFASWNAISAYLQAFEIEQVVET